MSNQVKRVFRTEMALARGFIVTSDLRAAWHHLERAHILGQRDLWAHLLVHVTMLTVALRQSDSREARGQITRIFATIPGFLFGWIPVGNTGGANVSPLKHMDIPDDLQTYFVGYSLWRGIITRSIVFGTLGIALLGLWIVDMRHRDGLALVEKIWQTREKIEVAEFGATKSLKITPLVNWHATSGQLHTEAGVSYLVETDGHKVLFDLGWNERDVSPSPLLKNMSTLGIPLQSIDTIFLSHTHRDHVGGSKWEQHNSFSLDTVQVDLSGKQVFAPAQLTYPNIKVDLISRPQRLLQAIASTGPIARKLFIGRIDEQALVINVEGKGLVIVVGCGHQTLSRLLDRIDESFEQPIYAIIGDLHYPVPDGRLLAIGINLQRVFASGNGPADPISREDIMADIAILKKRNIGFIALGGHDTSDIVLSRFKEVFGPLFRQVKVGDVYTI